MVTPDPSASVEFCAFTSYGARIGVRTNDAGAMPRLQNAFPPHWKPYARRNVDWLFTLWVAPPTRSRNKRLHTLYSNDEQVTQARDLDMLVDAFEREVQLAVAQKARGKVFVHAGVVGWKGHALVIPAKSFAGKSTLVRALVRAGATYYSDEFAVLDERGCVHPFARPLAVRNERLTNEKISFEELGGKIGRHPLPVGTVLVTKYRANAKWRPRLLTPGVGTLELLANTVMARSGNPLIFEVLTRVAKEAKILKSARGEANAFAESLLRDLA